MTEEEKKMPRRIIWKTITLFSLISPINAIVMRKMETVKKKINAQTKQRHTFFVVVVDFVN